jgi:hypothetical protein
VAVGRVQIHRLRLRGIRGAVVKRIGGDEVLFLAGLALAVVFGLIAAFTGGAGS